MRLFLRYKAVSWVLISIAALMLYACEQRPPTTNQSKPTSVPSEAAWVGGIDGGVYVLVTEDADGSDSFYDGRIYYEHGEVWYQGKMRLSPDGATLDDPANDRNYSGWDGDILYLTEGRELITVE